MATKTERILGLLPSTSQAGRDPSALRSVVDAFGGELLAAENSLAALMRAHWVDHADLGEEEIDDLARIAALYGLTPRPDESVEEFRQHLKRLIRIFIEGTTTVQGVLRIAAESLDLRIADDYQELDSWWTRESDLLETAAVYPLGNRRRRRFLTRARVTTEAAQELFGFSELSVRGSEATAARVTGAPDLSRGLDLRQARYLRLAIDGSPGSEVDCAGVRPRATTLGEVVAAINQALGQPLASDNGRNLLLTSPTLGSDSRIAFEPPLSTDALDRVLGVEPGTTRGTAADASSPAAAPARVQGVHDLSSGVDLSVARFLHLALDDGELTEIDCAALAADASQTSLAEIVAAIDETLGEAVAGEEEGRLTLTAAGTGPSSRIRLERVRAGDAREVLFGPVAELTTGSAPLPAVVTGEVEIPGSADLSRRSRLSLAVDGAAAVHIDVAGATPAETTLDEVVAAINGVVLALAGISAEGQLRLTSPTRGAGSRLEVRSLRHLEVQEYPPESAASEERVRHGDRWILVNRGAAESLLEVEILSPRGLLAPALVNMRLGLEVRLRLPLARGARLTLWWGERGARGVIVSADGEVRQVPSDALLVRALAGGGDGIADGRGALALPRGRSTWLYRDCLASRFDEAKFDQGRFAGEPCREWGIFDVSRFAPEPEAIVSPLFATPEAASEAPAEPAAELLLSWDSYRPAAFVVNLPADLPPRFGGRFDDARFAAAQPELFAGVVTEPAVDPDHLVGQVGEVGGPGSSSLVRARVAPALEPGFEAATIPFRQPRPLTLGDDQSPARIFLAEEGLEGFIEIQAVGPGSWGSEVAVAMRQAGPAIYELSVSFATARFESARRIVLGVDPLSVDHLPASAETLNQPGPIGVLQAKAAGVEVRVTRDRAD